MGNQSNDTFVNNILKDVIWETNNMKITVGINSHALMTINFKVDFQSVLRRLNDLFCFFVLKTTYVIYDRYEMYQFVTFYIKLNYNFCLPPSWM